MTAVEPTLPGPAARLLSLPDACVVLGGLSKATLYREMARGRLASVKVGSRSFITNDELVRYQRVLVEEGKQRLVPKWPNPGSRAERERRRAGRESAAAKQSRDQDEAACRCTRNAGPAPKGGRTVKAPTTLTHRVR